MLLYALLRPGDWSRSSLGRLSGFSDQGRKAFRRTRAEMGSVNAELQESISAVREVQAFNRPREHREFQADQCRQPLMPIFRLWLYQRPGSYPGSTGLPALVIVAGRGVALLGNGTLFGQRNFPGHCRHFSDLYAAFQPADSADCGALDQRSKRRGGGKRIFDLLDEIPQVQDKPMLNLSADFRESGVGQCLSAYKPGEPVLRSVNLTPSQARLSPLSGQRGR